MKESPVRLKRLIKNEMSDLPLSAECWIDGIPSVFLWAFEEFDTGSKPRNGERPCLDGQLKSMIVASLPDKMRQTLEHEYRSIDEFEKQLRVWSEQALRAQRQSTPPTRPLTPVASEVAARVYRTQLSITRAVLSRMPLAEREQLFRQLAEHVALRRRKRMIPDSNVKNDWPAGQSQGDNISSRMRQYLSMVSREIQSINPLEGDASDVSGGFTRAPSDL